MADAKIGLLSGIPRMLRRCAFAPHCVRQGPLLRLRVRMHALTVLSSLAGAGMAICTCRRVGRYHNHTRALAIGADLQFAL
eukprot:7410527-Heterocapsa_arctica.AAC.1